MYVGLSANILSDNSIEIGISIHDGTYSVDFSVKQIILNGHPSTELVTIENYVIKSLVAFSNDHLVKFVGGGITELFNEIAPNLCNRLWKELDIVILAFAVRSTARDNAKAGLGLSRQPSFQDTSAAAKAETDNATSLAGNKQPLARPADEQADSAARKCVMYFGPSHNPRLSIGKSMLTIL